MIYLAPTPSCLPPTSTPAFPKSLSHIHVFLLLLFCDPLRATQLAINSELPFGS